MPKRASGIEKKALRVAIVISQQAAIAMPPPTQAPCISAMVGAGHVSMSWQISKLSRTLPDAGTAEGSPMAAPAEKCLPAPRSTIARIAGSFPHVST